MLDFARRHFIELVLLANAGGFGVLLAELLLMDHTDGIQLVAPATAAGIALSLAAIVLPGRARLAPAVLLILLSGAGVLGVVRHYNEREDGLSLSTVTTAFAQSGDGDEDNSGRGRGRGRGGDDDDDAEPPPLAPLSLSGTAMLSALAAIVGAAPRPQEDGAARPAVL